MPEDKKHIDSLFREGLSHAEEKAPSYSWEVLSERIDQQKKMRRMRILRYAAASVAILLAFFTGREFSEDPQQDNQVANAIRTEQSTKSGNNFIADEEFKQVAAITIPQQRPASDEPSATTTKHILPSQQSRENTEARTLEIIHSLSPLKAEIENYRNIATMSLPARFLSRLLDDRMENAYAEADYDDTQPAVSHSGWTVGGFFSPLYTYRTTESQSFGLFDNSYKSSSDGPAAFEEGQITYAAGMAAQYQFSDKWMLETGFSYTRMGQSKSALVYENQPDNNGKIDLSTSAGRINGSKLPQELGQQMAETNPASDNADRFVTNDETDTELQQHFDYVEIPMLMKYKVYHDKVAINLISGISTGIMVNNNAVVTVDGKESDLGSTSNLRKFLYNSVVGFGLQYELSNGLYLNMEPTFKYALHSINPSDDYQYKPYSLGIYTGVSIGF